MKFLEHFRTKEDRAFWWLRLNGIEKLDSLLKPRIVFNVASLGELNGAIPVARTLRELGFSGSIILSVGTPTAFRKARLLESSEQDLIAVPAPLEIPRSVSAFLKKIQPDLFVNFEAEYWPMLFAGLKASNVPVILVNGRISKRSFLIYNLFSGTFSRIFRQFARLGMISETHRERAIRLGAHPGAVFVTGSSKYDDFSVRRDQKKDLSMWQQRLKTDSKFPIIVAGNLRGRECFIVVNTIKKLSGYFPNLLAVLAPRHLYRVKEIFKEASDMGFNPCFLSSLTNGKIPLTKNLTVIVVDTFGDLFDLYGIADIAFCGGTFEPIGGHNIVEPVVWGKKVLYGPFIHKVEREHEVLEKWGMGILCQDPDDLLKQLKIEVEKVDRCRMGGVEDIVHQAIEELSGASRIYASWIIELTERRRKN